MGKKKANGEGSITKRADGRYMGRFTVNGKRKTVYGSSHEEVRQKLNEKLNEVAKGIYIEPGKDTVGSWLRDWLVTYALPTVKQSTYISYEGYVRIHIEPELGNIKLTELKRETVQRFFNKKYSGYDGKKGLSAKTIKNIYNMFNSAITQAMINDKILRSPLLGVKLPKVVKKEVRVLTPEEQMVLQDIIVKSNEPQAFGITFDLSTGARLGELIGFQWRDVNYTKHSIRVRRTVGRLQKIDENGELIKKEKGVNTTELVIRPPKSSASRREIPLFDKLWNGLMAYRQQQIEIFDMLGLEFTEETYIFCNPMGNVYDPRVFEDLFKRKLEEAGLKEINFHALRHTFATRALEAGMDVKVLSALIGHAQPSTTLNLYGQALPDHKKASMEKMSGFYTGRLDTNEIRTQMERIAS